jgi:putative peptidoglycan lipid II flippase
VGIVAMGLNIGFSLLFSAWFVRRGWMPHGGLALANSLATALESIALILLMRKRLKGLEGTYVWKGVGLSILGTILMSVVVLGWQHLFKDSSPFLVITGALGFGLIFYLGFMYFAKVPELFGMFRTLLRRIKRRPLDN